MLPTASAVGQGCGSHVLLHLNGRSVQGHSGQVDSACAVHAKDAASWQQDVASIFRVGQRPVCLKINLLPVGRREVVDQGVRSLVDTVLAARQGVRPDQVVLVGVVPLKARLLWQVHGRHNPPVGPAVLRLRCRTGKCPLHAEPQQRRLGSVPRQESPHLSSLENRFEARQFLLALSRLIASAECDVKVESSHEKEESLTWASR